MTNPIHSATHPIWPLLRLVVMVSALTAVLWMNASEFDNTELQTIIGMFLIGGATEGVSAIAGIFTRKGQPDGSNA